MNDCDINDSRGNRDKTSERRTNFANCDSSSKRLKFGIDEILSSESSRTVGRQDDKYQDSGGTRYYDGPQCCQFNHVISSSYGHFCSPFYISASSFLPVVRKYANFVIEGDRNNADGATSKRKRIWSRAVFSKLQRKGLEKRFQVQKYIMKPDRKQLAATLGLTDAQVKVWFQNRRMKWRNSRENSDKAEPEQTSK